MVVTLYRHRLLHVRCPGAIYFVTWRLRADRVALSAPERDVVVASLRHFDGLRYILHAYVVMDDHVHVLLRPATDVALEDILHSWKSFSAKAIGRERKRSGPVWQEDSFDRVVRDRREYDQKRDYILANPHRRWQHITAYAWCWARSQ